MDAYSDIRVQRWLSGMLTQILYFSLRSVSSAVDMELLAQGIVTKKDLPQDPIFAPPRRK